MKNNKKKRKRQIEVFVSMCQICFDAVDLVNSLVGPDDEVTVLEVERSVVADRARELDILSVPCVVIDGEVAGCCQKGFPYEWEPLKAAGLGQPLTKTWKEPFIQVSPFAFNTGIFKLMTCLYRWIGIYSKKYPAISKRSSILSISEYKEVSYSDQMGTKIL